MAFVAVVPAVGSAVLPAIGAIGSGLGGALATGAGALGSGIAGIGSALGSVPLLGSIASPALSGLGGAIGGLGGGLGGALGALGAGNIGGALGSLGGGLGAAGANLFGSAGVGGGGGSGFLGMYGGLDKMLGGLLPNMGIGGTVAPAQGYLGSIFPGMQNSPMFGGTANPFATHGVMNFNPNNPFDLAQAQGLTAPSGGGIGGALGGLGQKAGAIQGLLGAIDATRTTTPTPQSVQHSVNLQRPAPGLQPNGGQQPQRTQGIYGNGERESPFGVNAGPARPNKQFIRPGAQDSLQRMYGN